MSLAERLSLRDLQTIVTEAKKWKIKLAVIGGYAVQAYTRAYRFTKDIDLVTTREGSWKLKSLLRDLGYTFRDPEFGKVLRHAATQGVEVYACCSEFMEDRIILRKKIKAKL